MDNIFGGLGVEIKLKDPDDFLKIKETLTRIGIPSKKENKLYQSCHILHKRGEYAIFHFKELFILDRKDNTISEDDIARRNTIVALLSDWNLLEVIDKKSIEEPQLSMNQIKVISFGDKKKWVLEAKYTIGNKQKYGEFK